MHSLFVPVDVLTPGIPLKNFETMIGFMDESFLITRTRDKLITKIARSNAFKVLLSLNTDTIRYHEDKISILIHAMSYDLHRFPHLNGRERDPVPAVS